MSNKIIQIASLTSKHWKSIFLIYFVQLFFGIFVAFLSYNYLHESIGSSLELDRLAKGFDRTVFSDMINNVPIQLGRIGNNLLFILGFYYLINIVLYAGTLTNIKENKYSIKNFVEGSQRYFLKFFIVALLVLFQFLLVVAIIWIPFVKCVGNPLETFHSEKTFIFAIIALLILTGLILLMIWIWSIICRYLIIEGNGIIKSIKVAWRILFSNFTQYYVMGLLLIVFQILLAFIYNISVDDWGAESWIVVFSLILIQQLFSVIRIWTRVFAYTYVSEISTN